MIVDGVEPPKVISLKEVFVPNLPREYLELRSRLEGEMKRMKDERTGLLKQVTDLDDKIDLHGKLILTIEQHAITAK